MVCSLPHYRALNTDRQRGDGVFERSIAALQALERRSATATARSGLRLVLVTNPVGAWLPGQQASLEAEWKRELLRLHGVRFDALYAITNMPISRFLEWLERSGNLESYLQRLVDAFNPLAVAGLMCRTTLSVGWDGRLYDCDFNQMLDLEVEGRAPRHLRDFDLARLAQRRSSPRATASAARPGPAPPAAARRREAPVAAGARRALRRVLVRAESPRDEPGALTGARDRLVDRRRRPARLDRRAGRPVVRSAAATTPTRRSSVSPQEPSAAPDWEPPSGLRYQPGRETERGQVTRRSPLVEIAALVDQLVLHYDACGTSRQCFKVLHDRRELSVHFLLDVDGTLYQTLDLAETAWHARQANERSIGVEIANIGAHAPRGPSPLDDWYATDAEGTAPRAPPGAERRAHRRLRRPAPRAPARWSARSTGPSSRCTTSRPSSTTRSPASPWPSAASSPGSRPTPRATPTVACRATSSPSPSGARSRASSATTTSRATSTTPARPSTGSATSPSCARDSPTAQ